MQLSAGKYLGLRRIADAGGRFKMLAVDQRPPIKNHVAKVRDVPDAPYDDVCAVKATLARALSPQATASLLDPHYAIPAAIHHISPTQGLIMTLEDSVFHEADGGRLSSSISDWSVEKIKRAGGDAVKVLAWYRPDAPTTVCRQQQDFVAGIGDQCRLWDIPFVFELLLYPLPGEDHQTTDYIEHAGKRADLVLESVRAFADDRFGVDVFKLESPLTAATLPDPTGPDAGQVQAAFDEMGRIAARPWVMLSAGATQDAFRRVLAYAYNAGASGYLAGRAIWWQAFQHFPDLDAMAAELNDDGVPYMHELNALTDAHATPWQDAPNFAGNVTLAGAGDQFRAIYTGIGGVGNT